jgi:hypothetical protein
MRRGVKIAVGVALVLIGALFAVSSGSAWSYCANFEAGQQSLNNVSPSYIGQCANNAASTVAWAGIALLGAAVTVWGVGLRLTTTKMPDTGPSGPA